MGDSGSYEAEGLDTRARTHAHTHTYNQPHRCRCAEARTAREVAELGSWSPAAMLGECGEHGEGGSQRAFVASLVLLHRLTSDDRAKEARSDQSCTSLFGC